jgi:hypothetical protein
MGQSCKLGRRKAQVLFLEAKLTCRKRPPNWLAASQQFWRPRPDSSPAPRIEGTSPRKQKRAAPRKCQSSVRAVRRARRAELARQTRPSVILPWSDETDWLTFRAAISCQRKSAAQSAETSRNRRTRTRMYAGVGARRATLRATRLSVRTLICSLWRWAARSCWVSSMRRSRRGSLSGCEMPVPLVWAEAAERTSPKAAR